MELQTRSSKEQIPFVLPLDVTEQSHPARADLPQTPNHKTAATIDQVLYPYLLHMYQSPLRLQRHLSHLLEKYP